MTKGSEVLQMLIPNGGYVIIGDEYEGIEFIEADPITKEEFNAGFAKVDAWKKEQEIKKASEKVALLDRLGITEDEARLLLG